MNTTTESGAASVWQPAGEMTIYTAADTKTQLDAVLARDQALDIDLSQVSELDTAGLQLLILAKLESQRRGFDLHIKGHSAAVVDVLDLCNMTGFFGDPVVMTSEIQ